MRIMKQIVMPLLLMSFVSVILLLGLSALTYIFKWQADTALVGITLTYIVAGFVGGRSRKKLSEEITIGKKLLEGIFLGTLFMFLLWLLSMVIVQNQFELSSRFLMIWMLLIGSVSLGRIL